MSSVPQPQDDAASSFQGRTFARFSLRNNVYCVPVDELEEQRLHQLNRIIRQVLNDNVVLTPNFSPPGVDEPEVLECGVGKGAWVEDLLEVYDECEVTGVDIYFGQGDEADDEDDEDSDGDGVQEYIKKRWNLNAPFRADRSSSRILPERFDLVNSRLLMDGINAARWPEYINDLRRVLKPRGWLQMVELELRVQSDNGRIATDDSEPLFHWYRLYVEAMERMGKNPRIGQQLGQLMRSAGFQNVTHQRHRLQIGRWNQVSASLGLDIRANLQRHIQTVSLWPLAGALAPAVPRMDLAEYRALVQRAQQRLQREDLRLYYEM